MTKSIIVVLLAQLLLLLMIGTTISGYVLIEDNQETLKYQLEALRADKPLDFNTLIDLLRRSLEKDQEFVTMQSDLRTVQQDITNMRLEQATNCGCSNKQKNEQLTIQWLSGSMSEIKGELLELAKAYNSSGEQQQFQSLLTEISILQKDIVTLRHDLETLKAKMTKISLEQSTVNQEAEADRKLSQNSAVAILNLSDKLQTMESYLSKPKKQFKTGKDAVYKKMVVTNEDPLKMEVATSALVKEQPDGDGDEESDQLQRYGHHYRYILNQLDSYKSTLDDVKISQKHLRYQDRSLHKQIRLIHGIVNNKAAELEQVYDERLKKLELENENVTRVLTNVTEQLGGQDRLRVSMLELLEALENLENKFDTTTPDMHREISKLEFSLTQTSSTTALLKEDSDNQRISLKAMGESLSLIQEKLREQQMDINGLKNNATLTSVTAAAAAAGPEKIQFQYVEAITHAGRAANDTGKLKEDYGEEIVWTYRKMGEILNDYQTIIGKLPRGCNEINGVPGLYLISPDNDAPILVNCEYDDERNLAYTVFQRRIDGTQDFNKNWEEYAVGFGSPAGEFWLGNEALYRLTKKNDTGLRAEFVDISGEPWFAEYSDFGISSKKLGYSLHVAGYGGNASDALAYQNRMQFSTVDSDRDISNTNCAENYEGGWWFSHCQHANLNGRYTLGLTWFDALKNEWIAVASTKLKIYQPMSPVFDTTPAAPIAIA